MSMDDNDFEVEEDNERVREWLHLASSLLDALLHHYPQGCNMFQIDRSLRDLAFMLRAFSDHRAAHRAAAAILSFNGDSARSRKLHAVLLAALEELA